MKLFTTVAVGALLLAGCAPFEHGHFAADVAYQNDIGDRPGTPVLIGGYDDPYYGQAIAGKGGHGHSYSTPASYSEPVYSPPVVQSFAQPVVHSAPIVQASFAAPVIHSEPVVHHQPQIVHHEPQIVHHQPQIVHSEPGYVEAPRYIEPPRYVEPASGFTTVDHYAQALPEPRYIEPQRYIEPAPLATAYPLAKPRHYVEAAPILERVEPIVAATSVSVEEERVQAPVVYAPPQVVNAPPVYMRGAPQYANQPFPAPGYPQFGGQPQGQQFAPPPPPNFGPPHGYGMPQGFGGYAPQPFPAPPAFGGYYGGPVTANTRPAFAPQGYGGYGASGCVTTCGNGSVF